MKGETSKSRLRISYVEYRLDALFICKKSVHRGLSNDSYTINVRDDFISLCGVI